MPARLSSLAGAVCALMLCVAPTTGQQRRYVSGAVLDGNDHSVAQTEVRIVGSGSDVTTGSGEFRFPLLPPLKVGFAVTFHVVGWVIIDPCILARGRTYLPDPDAESVTLKVLRPGDPRLLSGRSIGCLIEEEASHFEAKPASAGSPRSSLKGGPRPIFAKSKRRDVPAFNAVGAGDFKLIYVAYGAGTSPPLSHPSSQASQTRTRPLVDPSRASQARELGFTPEKLAAAIERWAKSTEDLYQRGLAALYGRRYANAARFISQSIPSPPGRLVDRYVPWARAEYEQGHYPAAESALRRVLEAHEGDAVVLNNLALVLAAEANYAEAESLYKRALAIDEKTGLEYANVATDLNNLALLYGEQGK